MRSAIMIFLALFTLPVWATGSNVSSVETDISGAGRHWHLNVEKGNVYDRLPDRMTLTDAKTGKTLLKYSPKDTSFYDKAQLANLDGYSHPLLLTEWDHGMHTICLKIFDPETTKAVVYKTCSDGQVGYVVNGDHISLSEGAATGGPADWNPKTGEKPRR